MSGIEVAGLGELTIMVPHSYTDSRAVLGALPLIIAGIEAYNDGLDPVKSFMRWERELPQILRKLRIQHVHYAQTIRILLEPITNEFELAELLQDPNGQLWKGDTMAKKLGVRLGESFNAYQNTIADIERITKKIASKIDLDRAANLNELEAILAANPKKGNDRFEFRKRVKFGMTKKSIKALLGELEDCNKELERFTDKSERIETIRRKTVKPSFANRFQRIQKYAASLHDTLYTCWSCTCQSSHATSLQLDQRSGLYAPATMKKAIPSSKTCFKVAFSSGPEDVSQPWVRQAAEIVIEEEEEDDAQLQLQPLSPPRIRKSVSFRDKPPPPYSVTDTANGKARITAMQEVFDLCASIQRHKGSPCIGFSFDLKKGLRGAYEVDAVSNAQRCSTDLISLEQLLDRPPLIEGRLSRLSKKERYSLAVTLASSTLQLNATPWFKDQWCAKDIMFYRTTGAAQLIDVDRPYVASKGEGTVIPTNGRPKRGFQNKNTILLALAVTLLELYFGVSAGKHRGFEESTGAFNPWTLCAMAYEWADEEQENLSAAFSSAVTHCLKSFNDPSATLQDVGFLQAAVECVVLPLKEELDQFLGKSGP